MTATTTQRDEEPATSQEGIWGPRYRLLTVGLVLVVVSGAFEALAVATTLPATVRDLGGLSLYGWAFSAFMLTDLVGIVLAGSASDRVGLARPFIWGVSAFTLGLFIGGLAPAMIVVIAGRAVQGFGAGALNSLAYAAIGRGYPDSAKARMLAVLSTAWVVPGLIGPALAGVITDHLGWRWVFLGLALLPPLAACLALPALRRFPPPRPDEAKRADERGRLGAAVRLAIGVLLALAGLDSRQPLPLVGLCVLGLALCVPALRRLLPDGTLLAARGLPAAVAATALVNLAFFGADSFVPLALTGVRGQSVTFAGLALTTGTIGWTSGAWLQERLAKRRIYVGITITGIVLIAAAIFGATAVLLPNVPVLLAPVAWAVAGLGMGLAYTTLTLVVLRAAPLGEEGAASAAIALSAILGTALGTGIGGALIGQGGASAAALRPGIAAQNALMILVAAVAIVVAMRIGTVRRPATPPGTPDTPDTDGAPAT